MVRYYHLPIYNAAMDMAIYLDSLVGKFSRYHKFTNGQDLRSRLLARGKKTVMLAQGPLPAGFGSTMCER
jgi:hypothetical protein